MPVTEIILPGRDMPIRGLMLHGAHTLLKSEDESAISDEPIWLSADVVDKAIERGHLRAGSLDGIVVQPPRADWPEEWKFLQTKE